MTSPELPRNSAFRWGIGEAHRRYTRHVNFREGWRGSALRRMAGPICVVSHGRGPSLRSDALCRTQPGASQTRVGPGGVSLEQCPRPRRGPGRRAREGVTLARSVRRLVRMGVCACTRLLRARRCAGCRCGVSSRPSGWRCLLGPWIRLSNPRLRRSFSPPNKNGSPPLGKPTPMGVP